MLMLAAISSALAADPATDRSSVGIGVRAVAETWDDAVLGDVYRTGMVAPAVTAVVPLLGIVQLDLEAAYRRVAARDEGLEARLEMAPLAALLDLELVHRDMGDLYLAAGPALTVFSERHIGNTATGDPTVVRGMRGALETRVGARIDTGLVRPSTIPDLRTGVKRLEVDVSAGRRFVLPSDTGFRLGAWRLQVGILARL
jgi:hypothetical protein